MFNNNKALVINKKKYWISLSKIKKSKWFVLFNIGKEIKLLPFKALSDEDVSHIQFIINSTNKLSEEDFLSSYEDDYLSILKDYSSELYEYFEKENIFEDEERIKKYYLISKTLKISDLENIFGYIIDKKFNGIYDVQKPTQFYDTPLINRTQTILIYDKGFSEMNRFKREIEQLDNYALAEKLKTIKKTDYLYKKKRIVINKHSKKLAENRIKEIKDDIERTSTINYGTILRNRQNELLKKEIERRDTLLFKEYIKNVSLKKILNIVKREIEIRKDIIKQKPKKKKKSLTEEEKRIMRLRRKMMLEKRKKKKRIKKMRIKKMKIRKPFRSIGNIPTTETKSKYYNLNEDEIIEEIKKLKKFTNNKMSENEVIKRIYELKNKQKNLTEDEVIKRIYKLKNKQKNLTEDEVIKRIYKLKNKQKNLTEDEVIKRIYKLKNVRKKKILTEDQVIKKIEQLKINPKDQEKEFIKRIYELNNFYVRYYLGGRQKKKFVRK
jgi:hypothetical protein